MISKPKLSARDHTERPWQRSVRKRETQQKLEPWPFLRLVIRKGRRLHEVDPRMHLTFAFNKVRVGTHSALASLTSRLFILYKGYRVYCRL